MPGWRQAPSPSAGDLKDKVRAQGRSESDLFRVSSPCCMCVSRIRPPGGKHSVQVQWVQNQIYYYVKRDVWDVSLLFGWCRYNLLIRFFLVYPRYVIDEPRSNGTVVGIFAVGFWRMCMCRFHAVMGPGRANECHV